MNTPSAVELLHPYFRRQAEAAVNAAEAETRAAQPSPREALQQAHADRREAENDVNRLRPALQRARDHLAEVEQHLTGLSTAIEADESAATDRLLAELAEGHAGRTAAQLDGQRRLALASAEGERTVAQRAVDRLAEELAATEAKLEGCVQAVRRAAADVLIEIAAREAETILADADTLDTRRASLDQLGIELTDLQRALPAAERARWPAVITQALQPELRDPPRLPSRFAGSAPEAARHWAAIAAALLDDTEPPAAA